jgi:hypothetical protein
LCLYIAGGNQEVYTDLGVRCASVLETFTDVIVTSRKCILVLESFPTDVHVNRVFPNVIARLTSAVLDKVCIFLFAKATFHFVSDFTYYALCGSSVRHDDYMESACDVWNNHW